MNRCKNMALDELRAQFVSMNMQISSVRLIDNLGIGLHSALTNFVIDQYVYDCMNGSLELDGDHNFFEIRGLCTEMHGEILYKFWELARKYGDYSRHQRQRPNRLAQPVSEDVYIAITHWTRTVISMVEKIGVDISLLRSGRQLQTTKSHYTQACQWSRRPRTATSKPPGERRACHYHVLELQPRENWSQTDGKLDSGGHEDSLDLKND